MKKLLAILLVLLLTVTCVSCAKQPAADSSAPAPEPAAEVPAAVPETSETETPEILTCGNYEYILDDGTATIVRFTDFDYEGELVIPDTLDGVRVTGIMSYAFAERSYIPGVTNPVIPGVFYVSPESTEETDAPVIQWDSDQVIVNLDVTNLETLVSISPDQFTVEEQPLPYSGITGITFPDSLIHIDSQAFDRCSSLSRIVLPDNLLILGDRAFEWCESLTEVVIPDSLAHVSANPFAGCYQLERIVMSPDHPYLELRNGMLFEKEYNRLICCLYNSISGHCVIPDGTVTIGDYSFAGNDLLTSVSIPDSVIRIGSSAFCLCTSLTTITLPESIKEIGWYAFSQTGLTEITIPGNITTIGWCSFSECSSLARVRILDGVNEIQSGAFYNNRSLEEIIVPASVTVIGKMAFDTMRNTSVIVVPGSYAEQYCRDNSIPYILN